MRIAKSWLLAAAFLSGCNPEAPNAQSGTVRVVDSATVAWGEEIDSMVVYRVEVPGAGRTDTLANVLTPFPVVTEDGSVWGLRRVPGRADRELFRWTGQLTTWPLPDDILGDYHDFAISPGGKLAAYVGIDSLGRPYPVVRALPMGSIQWRGPVAAGCDCDIDLSHARWISPDSFEIAVVSTADRRGWGVSRGSARRRDAQSAVEPEEPDWDQARP